jgi:hypothetical protein
MTETPHDQSATRPASAHDRLTRVLLFLELYTVAAYTTAAIVPYLWRHHATPPTWMLIVPGSLLGVPGFAITVYGPRLAVPLAVVGVVALAMSYRALSIRMRWWCLAATALVVAYAVFSLTPLAVHIAAWVRD